ncbi:MAG: hypothetical protein HY002_00650 [Candidatus Rokubacteria bacterium]|nr:hypothetical protein [Candidatus Rokubacteria bacterium]
MGTVVFVVTCEFCGQSWHRKVATSEQVIECVFCGSLGRLRLGLTLSDGHGVQHVEAWLRCARSSS